MVESAENVGTEFIIFLPAASSPALPEDNRILPQQMHARVTRQFLEEGQGANQKKRVLVVDDDSRIRKLASKILSHLGLDPVVAEDGEQALMLIRQSYREASSFDAIILDLNLPRLGGMDVMREIRKVDPSVKVLLSSGDTVSDANFNGEWDGILSKPYGKDAMEMALSDALSAKHHEVPQKV